MKKIINGILIMSTILINILIFYGCGININTIEDTVSEVKDGNTIVLSSGLTVHLCGIDPNSSFCKEYLQNNVKDKEVSLTAESINESTISSYDEVIDAYVHFTSNGSDLNRTILIVAGKDAFYTGNCVDSLQTYENIFKTEKNVLSEVQLCAKMTASSLLIASSNNLSSWIGTGFFINNKGLALTNNHVLNNDNTSYVYLSDSQGNVDGKQCFNVNRIVYTDPNYDYTIFYVDIDENTAKQLSYLELADNNVSRGEKLGAIGNPAPADVILTMSFATGTVSALRKDRGKIQINVPITHGYSGGPVCNSFGDVIGISQSGYETNGNLNFAVDIRKVREKLNELNISYAGK